MQLLFVASIIAVWLIACVSVFSLFKERAWSWWYYWILAYAWTTACAFGVTFIEGCLLYTSRRG